MVINNKNEKIPDCRFLESDVAVYDNGVVLSITQKLNENVCSVKNICISNEDIKEIIKIFSDITEESKNIEDKNSKGSIYEDTILDANY